MPREIRTWPRREAPAATSRTEKGTRPKKATPVSASESPVEGYWQEWTPQHPEPDVGYCTQLHLPPGCFLVYGVASVALDDDASGPSEVECSLFAGQENRFLTQLTLLPGQGQSIAATTHIESAEPTEVQWNCGGSAGPFRLQLAVNAITVHRLHHVGTAPGG